MLENDPINVDEGTPKPAAAAPAAALKARKIDGVTAAVALLVALAGGGLYAMHHRTSAGFARMAAVDASATDVDTLLAGGRESLTALSRSIRSTQELVTRLTNPGDREGNVQLASAIRQPNAAAPRDPFVFTPAETPVTTAAPAVQSDREQLRNEALAAARTLQVQSIMHGTSRKACLINGKLFFEGQAIDDRFTVQSISPDSVIVLNGDFRFELRLRK